MNSTHHGILPAAIGLIATVLINGCDRPATSGGAGSGDAPPVAVVTSSGVAMIALSGGEFRMGYSRGNDDEKPVHTVRLDPFLIDRFEVTHEQFKQAQLPNPSHWQDDPRKPVERVRWHDAKQYCNERSLMEGLEPCYDESEPGWPCRFDRNGYRLPTEAEWEYACRAGSPRPYDFGSPAKLKQFAWFDQNSREQTQVVGGKRPNSWGLHDMYGNVSEWCHDVYRAE